MFIYDLLKKLKIFRVDARIGLSVSYFLNTFLFED